MADIFLSYARSERSHAEPVRDRLADLGLTVFFDVDGLDGGDIFPDVLDREIKAAGAVVSLWSPHALTRPWVRKECLIALDRGVLVPASIDQIEAIDIPAAFYGIQLVDLSTFDGDVGHPEWRKLIRALARTLRRPDLIAKDSRVRAEADTLRSEMEAMRRELHALRQSSVAVDAMEQEPRQAREPLRLPGPGVFAQLRSFAARDPKVLLGALGSVAVAGAILFGFFWQPWESPVQSPPTRQIAAISPSSALLENEAASVSATAALQIVAPQSAAQSALRPGSVEALRAQLLPMDLSVSADKRDELWKQLRQVYLKSTFQAAADSGDPKAALFLGRAYYLGLDGKKDYALASKLFDVACEKDEAVGCTSLGYLYDRGIGLKRSHDRAVDWYTKACNSGEPTACINLGLYKDACNAGSREGCRLFNESADVVD